MRSPLLQSRFCCNVNYLAVVRPGSAVDQLGNLKHDKASIAQCYCKKKLIFIVILMEGTHYLEVFFSFILEIRDEGVSLERSVYFVNIQGEIIWGAVD